MPSRRWLFALVPIAALAIGAVLDPSLTDLAVYGPGVAAGIAAELGCAGVFVTGRPIEIVRSQDLVPTDPLLNQVSLSVDQAQQKVTATFLGLVSRSAIYRSGLGCTLLDGVDEMSLHSQTAGLKPMRRAERPEPWPEGDAVDLAETPPGVDRKALEAALDAAFAEATLGGKIDTRAVIVAYRGRIVAERYAFGFVKDQRFLGWSMGKSIVSALIGTLVADGKLKLDAPVPFAPLAEAKDGRQQITLKQLMQMRSGLAFSESYAPGDDSTAMLFASPDMARYAAAKPLAHPPGSVWSYSSGTSNIVARLVFEAAGGTLIDEYDYARTHLFEPTGMTSAEIAPDGTGSFVGSSYSYLTARDWARFGELYLEDGELNGKRILSEEWIGFTRTSSGPIDEPGGYGGQFWLNSDGATPPSLRWPHCPPDTYMALGHNDEIVAIVPSHRVVFVRLGWSTGGARFAADKILSRILDSLHDET
jgi:CubicO group peptidase (beta-lactamase class C family)